MIHLYPYAAKIVKPDKFVFHGFKYFVFREVSLNY